MNKRTNISRNSSDNKCPIWIFTEIDRSGEYAFDVRRIGDKSSLVLEKMISYSSMTWRDIMNQTHDDNRSKNHFLAPESISTAAIKRLEAKHLEDYSDNIFSFALTNKIRIVGIRDNEIFKVLWYDPNHEICPSMKK